MVSGEIKFYHSLYNSGFIGGLPARKNDFRYVFAETTGLLHEKLIKSGIGRISHGKLYTFMLIYTTDVFGVAKYLLNPNSWIQNGNLILVHSLAKISTVSTYLTDCVSF